MNLARTLSTGTALILSVQDAMLTGAGLGNVFRTVVSPDLHAEVDGLLLHTHIAGAARLMLER